MSKESFLFPPFSLDPSKEVPLWNRGRELSFPFSLRSYFQKPKSGLPTPFFAETLSVPGLFIPVLRLLRGGS